MNTNKALAIIFASCFAALALPRASKEISVVYAKKEARIKYFEAAQTCYESSKANPTLVVICPRLDEKDYDIK